MNSFLPLPPEILLNTGTHGTHEVVEVHDDVDTHVEEPTEGGVTSSNKPEQAEIVKVLFDNFHLQHHQCCTTAQHNPGLNLELAIFKLVVFLVSVSDEDCWGY